MPADIFANAASAKAIRRPLPGACGGCGGADGIIAAFHQAFLPHAGTCAIQACADSVLPRNDRPVIVSMQMNIIAAFPERYCSLDISIARTFLEVVKTGSFVHRSDDHTFELK